MTEPLSVITWKWGTAYTAEHVNVLARMVARNYNEPHRFVCVTNEPAGLGANIEVVPDWADFAGIQSPHGPTAVSCYRRLRAFHPTVGAVFGPRFVVMDLDAVVVGALEPLWDRPDPFVIWRDPIHPDGYCGSMFALRAGARARVWHAFNPDTSPRWSRGAGFHGSDQGWLRYCLGPDENVWTRQDGVYSFRVDVKARPLPADARVVFFHGRTKPWDAAAQALPWVREAWR